MHSLSLLGKSQISSFPFFLEKQLHALPKFLANTILFSSHFKKKKTLLKNNSSLRITYIPRDASRNMLHNVLLHQSIKNGNELEIW